VNFNAPPSLVEQADSVAALLDVSRTQLLVDALRDEIDALAEEEGFRRRLAEAYYAGEIDHDDVESILGTEEAMRMKLLRTSLDREPPEPEPSEELPSDAEFYGEDDLPEWTPDERADDTGTRR